MYAAWPLAAGLPWPTGCGFMLCLIYCNHGLPHKSGLAPLSLWLGLCVCLLDESVQLVDLSQNFLQNGETSDTTGCVVLASRRELLFSELINIDFMERWREQDQPFFGTGLLLHFFALTVIWKDFPWKQGKAKIQARYSVSMAHVSIGLFIVLYLHDSLTAVLVSKCGERFNL